MSQEVVGGLEDLLALVVAVGDVHVALGIEGGIGARFIFRI